MNNLAKAVFVCMLIIIFVIVCATPFVVKVAFGNQSEPLPLPAPSYLLPMESPNDTKQFDQSRWSYTDIDREITCMALNIYFEARNQNTKGQLAVGLVTINRVLSKYYPNNVCDVVWQKKKNKKGDLVAMFSWTLEGKVLDHALNKPAWFESIRVAESLLAEESLFNIVDFTNNADHYHADYVDPSWGTSKHLTVVIGDHLFYQLHPVDNMRASRL